jgi:hypothetical protein
MSTIPLTLSRPAFSRLVTCCAIAGVTALVLGAWTSSVATLRPRRELPHGVHRAMFALEMLRAEDLSQLPTIVHPAEPVPAAPGLSRRDEPAQIVRALQIDFAFIAAYSLFLVCVGLLAMRSGLRVLGLLIAALAVGAAVFDVMENNAILGLLRGLSEPLPRGPSLVKWSLLFATVGCIAPTLIDLKAAPFRRWVGYIGAFVSLAAAAEGSYGIANHIDTVIESAGSRLPVAFLLTWMFVTTAHTLRDGLLPALDRLAQLPVLRDLARWPSPDTNETVGRSVREP